jgi:hypothetical protein
VAARASYFGEKAKNLATKQDIGEITRAVEQVKAEFQTARDAQNHLYELALKSVDFTHQLRLAALDRRLAVHQEAFTLWWELQGIVHATDKTAAWNAAVACQNFWVKNHLYLTPEARQALYDAFVGARNLLHLRDLPRNAEGRQLFHESAQAVTGPET